MPIVSIDAPAGLSFALRKRLVREINDALSAAYGITENFIFLREYPRENVAIGGVLRAEAQPEPGVRSHHKSPPSASP